METFWSRPAADVLRSLGASPAGLAGEEAARRLAAARIRRRPARPAAWTLLLEQFRGSITLLLAFSALLSGLLGQATDAAIILAILLVSGGLGFWQRYAAQGAMARLLSLVETRAAVRRDGVLREVPLADVVPGDVVSLSAGDIVPADCLLLAARDLFADEAALTGESFPVEKRPGVLPPGTPLAGRTNVLFMGTHVVSGSGEAVAVATGGATEFGRISERLRAGPPETEFERGSRRFGGFLLEVTLVLVLAVFAVNVYFQRPVLISFQFALALAVGLTPQLLPAIISVNLAQGARRMARRKVIVKRPSAIENLGSMDLLCSDKTGTLTVGSVRLHAALGTDGLPSRRVAFYAYLNAVHQTGFRNPVDAALAVQGFSARGCPRLDEIPYDFVRKRLSVLVKEDGRRRLITKGAFESVLAVCTRAEAGGETVPVENVADDLRGMFREKGEEGFRILALAYRDLPPDRERVVREDERDMVFAGLLLFEDPPKAETLEAVRRLTALGVGFKMITGDNRVIARHVWRRIGLPDPRVLAGPDLARVDAAALPALAAATDVFAEVEPHQKERIVLALKRAGHVVGYLGDGINDGPALRAADVGVSVNTAVDVAREAADVVLLEKDLGVLSEGILGGRRTFLNTMKYIYMAASANFGNMFSMAGASLFLPFLPLLPKQILLTNLLTDLPEMTIATDAVDEELLARPRRWDIGFIRRFMIVFGLLSSCFDYLTFFLLFFVLGASPGVFRTGWFQESVISASLIVLVVRSRRAFFRSRPSPHLALATLGVVLATVLLPYLPPAAAFRFEPPPPRFLLALAGVVALYVAAAEGAKRRFYR